MKRTETSTMNCSNLTVLSGLCSAENAVEYTDLLLKSWYKNNLSDPGPDLLNKMGNLYAVFVILEIIYLRYYRTDKKLNWADYMTNVTQGFVFFVYRKMGMDYPLKLFYYFVYDNFRLFNLEENGFLETWTGYFMVFLAVDFVFYWMHRWSHEMNLLWAFHQVHHSSQHYNLTTAMRQPIGHTHVIFWIYATTSLLGIPPIQFYIHLDLNLMFQFWIHTEMIDKCPKVIEFIFNTPSHHRVHHGRNPDCIDTNYAGTLIIWDRIFGTFEGEKEFLTVGKKKKNGKTDKDGKRVEIAYGLVHNLESFSSVNLQTSHFQWMWSKYEEMKKKRENGNENILKLLFFGPGYTGEPSCPRLGVHSDIPEVEVPTKFLETELSNIDGKTTPNQAKLNTRTMWYVFLQLMFTAHACELLKPMQPDFNTAVLFLIVFIAQIENFARLLDGKKLDITREGRVNCFLAVSFALILGSADVFVMPIISWLLVFFSQ